MFAVHYTLFRHYLRRLHNPLYPRPRTRLTPLRSRSRPPRRARPVLARGPGSAMARGVRPDGARGTGLCRASQRQRPDLGVASKHAHAWPQQASTGRLFMKPAVAQSPAAAPTPPPPLNEIALCRCC